jgi:uncharacterized protein
MAKVNHPAFEIEIIDRRGQKLKADVYLPKGVSQAHSGEKFPTLLAASPYQKALRHLPTTGVFPFIEYGPIQFYLDHGYAYVIVDLPGSGVSEGIWDPWALSEGESTHDVIEHLATLAWCTGKIGMIGQSYYAMSQWNAARTCPPHLVTIAPFDGSSDPYRDWMYQGGIPTQGFLGSWLIGSVMYQHKAMGHDPRGNGRNEVLADVITHHLDDEWQRRRSAFWELSKITIPTFSIGVWGKASLHLRGNVNGYEGVTGPRKLLIAEPDSFHGAQALFDTVAFHEKEMLPWYDHHLKGLANDVMQIDNVRFFVNGANTYGHTDVWPPDDVQPAAFYLSSIKSSHVRSLNDGTLTEIHPVLTADSTSWTYPDLQWSAGVTSFVNGVPDHTARVNTYTTAPFEKAREFSGQGTLVLYGSSDQTDMDVMVKISLLPPIGQPGPARKVTQGWMRASHRAEDAKLTRKMRPFHSHQKEEPIKPGEVYQMNIELLSMSVLVKEGQRLRLEISNHDSLTIDAPMTHWYGQKVGTDTYHHNSFHPSHILLPERPVVDAS